DLSDPSSDHSLPAPSSSMRHSHHLFSLVPSIHRSSAAILDRPSHDSSFASPSRKRSRSPAASGVRSFEFAIDSDDSLLDRFEQYRSRETELEMDVDVADALRARRIDDRDVVEVVDRDEVEMGARGPVEVRFDRVTHLVIADDIPKPAQEEGVVEVTYETLGDLVQRFHDHTVETPVNHV
nr:hypothetical protein [Tanacetum cinerariifolium]